MFHSVGQAWQWKMNHLKMYFLLTNEEVAIFFATSLLDDFWKQETHLLMAEKKGRAHFQAVNADAAPAPTARVPPIPSLDQWARPRWFPEMFPGILGETNVNNDTICVALWGRCVGWWVKNFFPKETGALSVVMDGLQWTHFAIPNHKPFEYVTLKNRMAGWPSWSVCTVLQENLAPGFGKNPTVEISRTGEMVKTSPNIKGVSVSWLFLRRQHWQPHPTTGKSWVIKRGCLWLPHMFIWPFSLRRMTHWCRKRKSIKELQFLFVLIFLFIYHHLPQKTNFREVL